MSTQPVRSGHTLRVLLEVGSNDHSDGTTSIHVRTALLRNHVSPLVTELYYVVRVYILTLRECSSEVLSKGGDIK